MNKLQEKEFEILKCVIGICDELKINYYLVCGTALGAVKYGGFIPWDDDVDIAMLRADYEAFCKKAPDLLPDNLFLQTAETDLHFPQFFCKIRDSKTTFIETAANEIDMNHGVYIDIFPLDGYPKGSFEQRAFEIKKEALRLKLASAYKIPASAKPLSKALLRGEKALGFNKRTRATVKKLSALLSKYGTEASDIWCNHGNWQGRLEYAPKEQYGSGTFAKFEGLKVRVPERYDEYLTQKYGDWRADLPVEEQVGHHYADVIDLNRPFTDYTVKSGKGKIRLKSTDELKKEGINPPTQAE